jgi:hypothetical protein
MTQTTTTKTEKCLLTNAEVLLKKERDRKKSEIINKEIEHHLGAKLNALIKSIENSDEKPIPKENYHLYQAPMVIIEWRFTDTPTKKYRSLAGNLSFIQGIMGNENLKIGSTWTNSTETVQYSILAL